MQLRELSFSTAGNLPTKMTPTEQQVVNLPFNGENGHSNGAFTSTSAGQRSPKSRRTNVKVSDPYMDNNSSHLTSWLRAISVRCTPLTH